MQLIWYNPEDRSYHTGGKLDYEIQLAVSRNRNDFYILDKLENWEARVADKIVQRLNKAYAMYEL